MLNPRVERQGPCKLHMTMSSVASVVTPKGAMTESICTYVPPTNRIKSLCQVRPIIILSGACFPLLATTLFAANSATTPFFSAHIPPSRLPRLGIIIPRRMAMCIPRHYDLKLARCTSHLHARISPRVCGERINASIICGCPIFSGPAHAHEASRTICRHGSHLRRCPSRSSTHAPMPFRIYSNWQFSSRSLVKPRKLTTPPQFWRDTLQF